MQRLEVSGAVRPIYGSLGVKRLRKRVSVPEDSSDDKEKRTYSFHCQNSNPGPPIPQPIRYID